MVDGELSIAVGEMLDLLLLGEDLLVEEVDLLGGDRVVGRLGLLAGGRGFAANIVKRIFTVCSKLWVFEFPSLWRVISIPVSGSR